MHSYNRHVRVLESLVKFAINDEGKDYVSQILKYTNQADLLVFSVEQTEKAVASVHEQLSHAEKMGKYQEALWLPLHQNIQEGTTVSTVFRCLTFHEIEEETYQVITTAFHPNGIGSLKNKLVTCYESKLEKQEDGSVLLIDPNSFIFEATDSEGKDLNLIYSGYIGNMPKYFDQEAMRREFYDSIGGCFFCILWAYQPRQTLIRQSNTSIEKNMQKKQKKALRFDNRPHIKIFDPEEVKVLYHKRDDQGGTHASPVPHIRRSHVRRYSHPRYVNMRGKTQSVSGAVVNALEGENFQVGKQVYCIMKMGEESPIEDLIL